YRFGGRMSDAVAVCDRWLPLTRAALKRGHNTRKMAVSTAVEIYVNARCWEKLEPELREQNFYLKQEVGADSPVYAGRRILLGEILLHLHKYAEAETVLRECLAIREKKQPDAWQTFSTRSMLGGALLSLKKFADAEPLLVSGYEGMKR